MNSFIFKYIKTIIKLCIGSGVQKSYSQFGEDVMMHSLCKDKKGFYVDIGTYDPVLYSNTYALYKRGWSGLVIDPNIGLKSLYTLLRPRDTFVSLGIGSENVGTYHRFNDGAYNTFNDEVAQKYKKLNWLHYIGSVECKITSLSSLITVYKIQKIDFLNIDVEGNDMNVLQSYDWSVRPRFISVESSDFNPNTPHENKLYKFLYSKNYKLVGLSGVSLIWSDGTKNQIQ